MTFPFTCSACGFVNQFEWSQIGQLINCAGCEKPMKVPVPMDVIEPAVPPPQYVKFRCPSCQRKFSAKGELAGKKIRCSGCGAGVRIPAGDLETAGHPAPTERERSASAMNEDVERSARRNKKRRAHADRDDDEEDVTPQSPLLDELGWLETKKRRRHAEPTLSSRTELMEQVRQQAAEAEAVAREAKAEKLKKKTKKRRKTSGYFDAKETLQLVAGVGAVVGVLAFLAWGYPGLRFPLGGILCVIGFIVYLLGWAAIRQLVAEEGVFIAILFRFVPPYQWWYVITRWSETREYFAFFAAGLIIMGIGSAVIKTSEEGKRAEASDRAFRQMQKASQPSAPPPAFLGDREP
jgi:DNA-directed RNA polymerase subunit RPC12/RpoP